MKFPYFFLAASLGILAACSGFERDFPEEIPDDMEITDILFHVLPVIDDDCVETKASSIPRTDYNVSFAWEETDKIGIFPDQGSQLYFVSENGAGTNSASFTGGGWALKTNSTYVSYFPFVADFYLDRSAIPVSFAGQKQMGTEGPFDGARWILATDPVQSQNGRLTFTYNILNTIINVLATLPAGTYTSASLNISEPLFVEEGTFSLDDQEIVGTSFSKTLEVELENFTLTSNAEVPIYFMAAPVDLTGKEVTVIITKDDGTRYKCVKTPSAPYNAGRRRGLTCAMQKVAEIINFSDPEVKRICVENWDADGDREVDKDEAASVTDLGLVFMNNTELVSFDELQYFTGLVEICDYCFSGCSNLSSIILPDAITRIGKHAFYQASGSSKLSSFNIPDGVILEEEAFCINTDLLTIPGCTINGGYVFSGRFSSISFTGPMKNQVSSPSIGIIYDNSQCYHDPTSIYFGKDFSYTSVKTCLGEAIGGLNYADRSIETIVVASDNQAYDSRNDCNAVIETNTNTLLLGCKNTVIPEDVTVIGDFAFAGQTTSLTIPESVSQIGSFAFYRSWEMSSIIILAATPPSLSEDFLSFGWNTPSIFVPSGSVNAYKTATGWCDYADKIFSVEEYVVPEPGNDGND